MSDDADASLSTAELHAGGLHVESYVVASGRPDRRPGASVNVPVDFTSTYAAEGPVIYARVGNPTWDALESALGGLEHGRALVHASGMGAIAAALSSLPHGGTLVMPDQTYKARDSRTCHAPQTGVILKPD